MMEEEKNQADKSQLRSALKSMFKFSYLPAQFSGVIIFKPDNSNCLTVSWIVLTSYIANFFLQAVFFLLYVAGSSECGAFFAEYSSVDRRINFMQTVWLASGGLLIRFWNVWKWGELKTFHESLNQVACNLLANANSQSQNAYLERIKLFRVEFQKRVILLAAFLFISLAMFCSTLLYFLPLFPHPEAKIIILLIVFILFNVILSVISPSLMMLFSVYIQWLQFNFEFISTESKMLVNSGLLRPEDVTIKVKKLWGHMQNLEILVQQFNSLFEFPIVLWIASTTSVMLHQAFVILRWIQVGFYVGAVYTSQLAILYPVTIFSMCNTCFHFSREV